MGLWGKNKPNNRRENTGSASCIQQDLMECFEAGYKKSAYYASQSAGQIENASFIQNALLKCHQSINENIGIKFAMTEIGSSVAAIRDIEAREYFKDRFLEYCKMAPDGALIVNDTDEEMLEKAARG